MKRKIFSVMLVFCMLAAFVPCIAQAATDTQYGDWYYNVNDGGMGVTITDYGGNAAEVIIPDKIENLPVTAIGNRAFALCTMTSITIPNGITSIGESAFEMCHRLTSINIPDSVTTISDRAFIGCHDLVRIDIPDSVTSIGKEAFINCSNLTSINVDSKNPNYSSTDGNLFDKEQKKLIQYATGKTNNQYTIPDSVISIGNSAFWDCHNLTSIDIPGSVIFIGDSAFQGCGSLKSVNIDRGVVSIGEKAFYQCFNLTSIDIPDSVTSIGIMAFYQCSSLKSITIGNGVTSIGGYAFYNTGYYTGGNWKDKVLYIGNYLIKAKDDIIGDYSVQSGTKLIADGAFSGCSGLTSITIPDSVTSIDVQAFYGCSSLTSITIPASVTNIGDGPFAYCSGLTSINVDPGNSYYCSVDGNLFDKSKEILIQYAIGKKNSEYTIPDSVTNIGNYAFLYCTGLTIVSIPNRVTSIGSSAFQGCTGLTSIDIPDSVTSIGAAAFYGCTGLKNIDIPDSVTNIDSSTFRDCSSLTSITIPDSVMSIGSSAFSGCSGLTSVNISDSVMSIGYSAFYGCESLTDVYYGGNESDWQAITIDYANYTLQDATIHYNSIINEPVESIVPVALSVERVRGGYVLTADTERAGTAYAAVYDASGALKDVAAVPFENGTAAVSPDTSGAAKIKFFVWASKLRPITYAETVTY